MWPYKPPSKYDVTLLSDVYRPPGYILLSEVVEMVGKAMMGEEWTGEELKARSLTNAILQESSHLEQTSFSLTPDGMVIMVAVDGRLSPVPDRWTVITTRGDRLVNSQEEARALWNQEEPKLRDMWDREDAARQRHTTIARKLQRSLNAAVLPSWAHRLNVGDLWEIKPHVWGHEDIPSVFELGNRLSRWRVPNFIKFMDVDANGLTVSVEGRVVLRQSDVERYIAPAPTAARPNRRGRRKGTVGYDSTDMPLIEKMNRLIESGDATSPWGAALLVVDDAKGKGSAENKIKRLTGKYIKKYGPGEGHSV